MTQKFFKQMDVESYQSLVLKTKESLDTRVCRKSFIATHFSSVLVDCQSCISLSLDLVTNLLEGSITQVSKLCGYIEDAISLIQMLSNFIKCVIESAVMSCCSMKPFPIATANVILTVFMHCKDSEYIYGNNLKSVQTQLKDLFRTCHELQLTYLMAMEKHFIFDLTEKEEQEILMEALNINMRIGEIVQVLDIKTMAEQWKAYTVICEKYSNFLQENNIYNKCTQLFSSIIMDNIKTAIEHEQDSKAVVRSLKVANFAIKILLRLTNVFKQATSNNYETVVELLQYIFIYNPAYLKHFVRKPEELNNLFVTNILSPTESLCNILLQDERFLNCIHLINVKKQQLNDFLGFIILVISLMRVVMQRKEDQEKWKLIDCVYKILPMGHYWFNMGLRFHIRDSRGLDRTFGLYEYLLVHTVAFACTLNSEQYAVLERYMYEAILSTDCYKAIFSSNLWVILARISNELLGLDTLSFLINAYQKLEKLQSFKNSPQDIHLRHTINNLFSNMSDNDKRIIIKQFQSQNCVWSVLRVCHLPNHSRINTEAVVMKNMKESIDLCFESGDVNEKDIVRLIQYLNVAVTCSFTEYSEEVEQYIVKLWLKACHKNKYMKSEDFITAETEWFYKYLEALVALTENIQYKYINSYNLCRILHIISTILDSCNTEMIIMLFNLYCTLTFDQREDENRHVIESMFKSTLKLLLQDVNASIRSFILENIAMYKHHERFCELTSAVFHENEFVRNKRNSHSDAECNPNSAKWNEQLIQVSHYEFSHKCLRTLSGCCTETTGKVKSTQSNFDLGDFLFDDGEEEPSRKKAKLYLNEVESLVERLESDTELLSQIETPLSNDHKKRIDNAINKLRNIVS